VSTWLREHLVLRAIDSRVRAAIRLIGAHRGEIPVAQIARDVDLSTRQLERRFKAAVGLTPKEYARVRRMRSGIAAVLRGEKQWSMLAASLGYADQSHLVREFGDMTGLTPGDLQNRLDRIEHDGVNP
jgi:AraC-like DNA-binding protein